MRSFRRRISHTMRLADALRTLGVLLCSVVSTEATEGPLAALPRLFNHLMANYTKMRPRSNITDTVEVGVHLGLTSILDLDGRSGSLTILGTFSNDWYDEFLVWDPSLFGGASHITLGTQDVWLPDVYVFNSMSESASDNEASLRQSPVMVKHSGGVRWEYFLKSRSACELLDMTLFPFDTQTCSIKYSTRISSTKDITLYNTSNYISRSAFIESGEFLIASNSVMIHPYQLSEVENAYVVEFTLVLRRRPAFYILNMLLPCVALVFLGLLAFCLPMTSGERVSLQITMLLSFSIYQLMLEEMIPNTSTNIPILSRMIVSTMIIIAFSVAANVLIIHVHSRHTPVPPFWRAIIFQCLGKLMSRDTHSKDTRVHAEAEDAIQAFEQTEKRKTHMKSGESTEVTLLRDILLELKKSNNAEIREPSTNNRQWIEVARILDGFFLLLFTVTFAVLVIYASIKYCANHM